MIRLLLALAVPAYLAVSLLLWALCQAAGREQPEQAT